MSCPTGTVQLCDPERADRRRRRGHAAGDGVAVWFERLVAGTAKFIFVVHRTTRFGAGKYAGHGDWMIRAYAPGLGAGTQVLTHLPWFMFVKGWPGEFPRAMMMSAGWAINVVVAEWIIRRAPRGQVVNHPVLRAA